MTFVSFVGQFTLGLIGNVAVSKGGQDGPEGTCEVRSARQKGIAQANLDNL